MNNRLPMSEAEFTDTVIQFAMLKGWMVAHFRPARMRDGRWRTAMQGHKGFPDLVLARGGRVIFAELKVASNQMTNEQEGWAAAIGPAQHYVWRPEQLKTEIAEVLR